MNKMTATRTLGTGDAALEVSAIGYGCMGLDSAWGTPMQPADAITLLRQAHDRGVTFFDTAEAYGQGSNEEPRRRSTRTDPRPGRDRHQVRLRSTDAGQRRRQPTGTHPASRRRRRSDGCAPTTSTSSTNTASTRTSPSKTSPAPSATSSPPARSATSGCPKPASSTHPPRPRRPARHRAAERVLAVVARTRTRDHPDARRARHRPRPVQPARQRLPHRNHHRRHHLR